MTRSNNIVNIVSPPFACGIAWLINALQFLDIKTTNLSLINDHWQQNGTEWTISDNAASHLMWHLPVLHHRKSFNFPEDIEIHWEHRLDLAVNSLRPTILYVRDPRDAIYSLYRRNYEMHFEFLEYLNRPDVWHDHFPGLFNLPPFNTFTYFISFWIALGTISPLLIVRHEDVKKSPNLELRKILNFLQLHRSSDEIAAAVRSSHIDNARTAMEAMEKATNKVFKTVRNGSSGEWLDVYPTSALKAIEGPGEYSIEKLGYANTSINLSDEWILQDIKKNIVKKFNSSQDSDIAVSWLNTILSKKILSPFMVCNDLDDISLNSSSKKNLLLIYSAIWNSLKIFPDFKTSQSILTLSVFINLNLEFKVN